jgi:hypothetical protein
VAAVGTGKGDEIQLLNSRSDISRGLETKGRTGSLNEGGGDANLFVSDDFGETLRLSAKELAVPAARATLL